ncbi:MAG: hypothetical protein PHV74_03235 [Dehalococcoidia bacterium]|nr:hypothetical protein [Dehalococcoidia bacterium]
METNKKIDELESELKVLKNEVQSVLIDIREHVLSYYKNPFQMVNLSPPKGEGADSATSSTNTNVSGGKEQVVTEKPPERNEQEQDKGAKMEDIQEGTSQLKALMDQLERERQALKQERLRPVAATPAPLPEEPVQPEIAASPGPAAQFSQPSQWGGQSMPGSQPPGAGAEIFEGPSARPVASSRKRATGRRERFDESEGEDRGNWSEPRVSSSYRAEARGARLSDERQDERRPGVDSRGGSSYRAEARGARLSDERQDERRPGAESKDGSSYQAEARDTKTPEEGIPAVDGKQMNLLTLVGLVRWVERSIKKVGKEKVEAIVEIYRTAGYLPETHKEIIAQIIRLAEGEKPEGPVTMGASILVLLQLDSLLGGKFQTESSIISTLFNEDGGYPWTKQ